MVSADKLFSFLKTKFVKKFAFFFSFFLLSWEVQGVGGDRNDQGFRGLI